MDVGGKGGWFFLCFLSQKPLEVASREQRPTPGLEVIDIAINPSSCSGLADRYK